MTGVIAGCASVSVPAGHGDLPAPQEGKGVPLNKSAAKIAGVLISAAVLVSSAGTGVASAHAAAVEQMSLKRELSAVAERAGVSEATIYRMAVSVADNPPRDEYRFPEEAFQDRAGIRGPGWRAIYEFVKRNWRKIVNAAKREGVWAWHKAGQCAQGAAKAIHRAFGDNLDSPEAMLAVAIVGCVKALRGR